MNSYAVITGASSGIGLEIARLLAKRHYHLIIIARSIDKLLAIKKDFEENFAIKVEAIEADLSDQQQVIKVCDKIVRKKYPIKVLINNAGFGTLGNFEDEKLSLYLNMLDLNVKATTIITHKLLPTLVTNSPAFILNVASLAAFYPIPTKALYAASKAMILSFTLALRQECKSNQVYCSALCPGGVPTSDRSRSSIKKLGYWSRKSILSAEEVAKSGIRGLFSRKAIIVPGSLNKFSLLLIRLIPHRKLAAFTQKVVK